MINDSDDKLFCLFIVRRLIHNCKCVIIKIFVGTKIRKNCLDIFRKYFQYEGFLQKWINFYYCCKTCIVHNYIERKKKKYMTLEGKIHYYLIRIHIRSQLGRLSYKLKFRYVS